MTDKDIISIKNFKLSFGNKEIIRGLSFNVKKGEIFGFLGSNGSGKTTTIRALLGIYQADSGELLINGEEFSPERVGAIG
ncbi:MAG: ATP-binding cassette domain-containing protein, partial [Candidatus Saccharimonas sp.]